MKRDSSSFSIYSQRCYWAQWHSWQSGHLLWKLYYLSCTFSGADLYLILKIVTSLVHARRRNLAGCYRGQCRRSEPTSQKVLTRLLTGSRSGTCCRWRSWPSPRIEWHFRSPWSKRFVIWSLRILTNMARGEVILWGGSCGDGSSKWR